MSPYPRSLSRILKSCQISVRVCHCSQTEFGKKGNYLENNLTPRTMSAPLQSVTILILQKSTIETQLALIVSSEAQLLGSGDILRSCTFSWSSVIKGNLIEQTTFLGQTTRFKELAVVCKVFNFTDEEVISVKWCPSNSWPWKLGGFWIKHLRVRAWISRLEG